eukprot:29467-Pelagococcus_subviridis.AAC.3
MGVCVTRPFSAANAGETSFKRSSRFLWSPLASLAISDFTARHPMTGSLDALNASAAAVTPSLNARTNAATCGVMNPPPVSDVFTMRSSAAIAGIITAFFRSINAAESTVFASSPKRNASSLTNAQRFTTSAWRSRNDERSSSSCRTHTRPNSATKTPASVVSLGDARRSAAEIGSIASSASIAFATFRAVASRSFASSSALTSHAAAASSAAAADSTAIGYAIACGASVATRTRTSRAIARTLAASERSNDNK